MQRVAQVMARWGLLMLAAALLGGGPAVAADTIKIVVPFAAGGPVDMVARLVGQAMQENLHTTVVVENRGGAGGALGNEAVARAAADGKTLLLGSIGSQVLSPTLRPPTSYDPVKSFTPIALVGTCPSLLVIRPQTKANTLGELIALAKGGQALRYGSAGPGTTMNIAGEMLNAAAGIQITHVPYRGASPAINDLMGGHVDVLIADVPILLPLVTANSVRPLALLGPERAPLLPSVQTTKELGFPQVRMENWYGVFAPAGIAPDVQAKLERSVLEAVATPAVRARLADGGIIGPRGREEFKAQLDQEFGYWSNEIKRLGIVAE